MLTWRHRHFMQGRGLPQRPVHFQGKVQAVLDFNEGFPCSLPRRPRTHHCRRCEAFRFGPRELSGSKLALRGAVGEVQTHCDRYRFEVLIDAHHAFNLVMHFSGMLANGNRPCSVEASRRFDEQNGLNSGLIAEFQSVF